jgi:hypothetical protein
MESVVKKRGGYQHLSLQNEVWKPVSGTDLRYYVSNLGRILTTNYKNSGKASLMKPALDGSGYYRTMIKINGKYQTVKIHRVIAQEFIPNPLNKPCINHINAKRADNKIENLEWATFQENANHCASLGRQSVNWGEKCGTHKLKKWQVLSIRKEIKSFSMLKEAYKTLSKKYFVSEVTIEDIHYKRTWKRLL